MYMKKISFFAKIKNWMVAHKISTVIILIIIIGGGYYTYKKTTAANAAPQYVLAPARMGTITQTVTGSGQVNAENQLDVTSEVSAKILAINASVGQHVKKR
jgi:HlyD family secretion protein